MSEVYFLKDFTKLEEKTKEVLKGFFPIGTKAVTKIHFGEPGNIHAFRPSDLEPLVKAMKYLGVEIVFLDTPVVYNSPRNSVAGYEEVVKDGGWNKLAGFVISGDYVKIKTKDFIAEVAKELTEAENVMVVSHVKAHGCCGVGGTIKNLGMGGVSRETKKIEHSLAKPKFISECVGCGTCVSLCPVHAIEMIDGKAKFDLEKCIGCSVCQENCSFNCLAPEAFPFDDLLAQAAAAVINSFAGKAYYINFLKNIARKCDCSSDSGGLISSDIGILFSDNPVAIDRASVDLVNQANGEDLFKTVTNKDPLAHIDAAANYINKETDYKLIVI
ncbi:MAG: DUF362 domain-containing protein [bacterium]